MLDYGFVVDDPELKNKGAAIETKETQAHAGFL